MPEESTSEEKFVFPQGAPDFPLMGATAIDKKLESHKEWIRDCYEEYAESAKTEWKDHKRTHANDDRRADFSAHRLELNNWLELDVRGAKFLGSVFPKPADLKGANLENAYLRRAHLEHAILNSAHLKQANLRGAHLENAKLRGANFDDADLRGANLEGANPIGANLERADLRGAHLEELDFGDEI